MSFYYYFLPFYTSSALRHSSDRRVIPAEDVCRLLNILTKILSPLRTLSYRYEKMFRFEVLMVVTMSVFVFWVMTSRGLEVGTTVS